MMFTAPSYLESWVGGGVLRLGPGARPTRVPQGESDEAGMGSGLLALSTWPEFPHVKQRSSFSQVRTPVMGAWRGQRKGRE